MAELLVIEGLTKRFRGLVANNDVSFALAAGELRCIIGPNGAGKTTFISMISGHVVPTSGRILFKSRDITKLPVHLRARIGIGRKFQTPTVFDNLSVYENIELAVLATPTPSRGRHARIMRTLDLVRLAEQSDRMVGALAHGQRQWLEIGILLAGEAQLLLLDEPTAGMTAEETHSTGELLRRLVRELELSAIIIEHDINFIRDLKAPVTVLHLGRVLVEGSFADIERNEQVRSVYLGNA
ncbi:MAG: ATP-binding cassette domain-containing protein [Alphaproteobacteria bacterium]|nr:ATP-binding cassette domain-containing protein [Alphaproteobacteria bacterium]